MGFSFEEKKEIFLKDMIARKTRNESTIEPLKNLSESFYSSRNLYSVLFMFSSVNFFLFLTKYNSYRRNAYAKLGFIGIGAGILFYNYKNKLLNELKSKIDHKDNSDLHEKISFYSSCIIEKNIYQ